MKLKLRGSIDPADKLESDYLYLPFDVPEPLAWLQVRYRYTDAVAADRPGAGNVIDIGLFDPRGTAFPGGAGFRGWSGSAREEFSIAQHVATPGYLPGSLPAGRYQIVLGLYHIGARGADYEIEIAGAALEPGDAGPAVTLPGARPGQPASPGLEPNPCWLRGDLQSHSHHSDAQGSLEQLIKRALVLGLDFLAVTDHNTISHHRELLARSSEQLLLLPGQECTTYYGHMNIWGPSRWCDFRCRTNQELAAIIALAHAYGGLCSINHPKPSGPAWQYSTALPVDAIEIWQGPWPTDNAESLALWEQLLMAGRRVTAVGGSDYHCPAGAEQGLRRLGQPTTWVLASERSVPALLEGIRAGRVTLSAAPDGPRIELRAALGGQSAQMGGVLPAGDEPLSVEVLVQRGAGYTLRLIADGAPVAERSISGHLERLQLTARASCYLRAELIGTAPAQLPAGLSRGLAQQPWRWAISNPVYIE